MERGLGLFLYELCLISKSVTSSKSIKRCSVKKKKLLFAIEELLTKKLFLTNATPIQKGYHI